MATWSATMFQLCCLGLLIQTAASFPSLMCRDPASPMVNSSEVLRRRSVKTIPYRLHVIKDNSNISQAGSEQYRVEISSKNSLLKFTTAQIAVVKTETCGYGELKFTKAAFYKEERSSRLCPVMLLTMSSEDRHKSPPLLWKPPTCGCVQLRALVFEDKSGYYSDEKDVNNGPLTTTICVRKREDRLQYANALCRIKGRYSAAEIVNRDAFKIRHGLREAVADKRLRVAVYEERLKKIAGCCREVIDSRRDRCFDRARFHRVDRLCEDGLPDLAFTTLRRAHTRRREKKCCYLMATHRYTCFNHKSDFPSNSSEAGILDYSLDETDPLNDLSDIATPQDGDILSMLSRLEFGAQFESDQYESFSMIDVGSKQVSSEEKSSEVSVGVASSRREVSEIKDTPRRPTEEDDGVVSVATSTETAQPRQSPVRASTSARRVSGGKSRRRGQGRGRHSNRRRNSGQRRRSGRESWEARRRNNARRRSGSKERKRKLNSRARQSRRVESPKLDRDFPDSWTSAGITRRKKMMERQRLSKTCCAQGAEYGSQLIVNDGESYEKLCDDEAETRESIILDFESKNMANICWFKFSDCCQKDYLYFNIDESGIPRRTRLTRDRAEAVERSDEDGDDLDLGTKYAEGEKESEKRYQHMRGPQIVRGDDDDEKDGPARLDEMDQGRDNGRAGAVDTVRYVEDTQVASGGTVEGRSTASEEIQDFDDRAFGDSREDDEEGDDDEEDDEEGENQMRAGTMLETGRELQRQRTSRREVERSQEQDIRNSMRRRNSRPWTSRRRNRSNASRERRRNSKGSRNSRVRTSRRNKSNLWNSRNKPGRYRSMPRNEGQSSRRQEYRNKWKKSRRQSQRNSRSNTSRFSERRTDRRFDNDQRAIDWHGQHQKRRRTPLDSKEMVQQYRHPKTGMELVEKYYEK